MSKTLVPRHNFLKQTKIDFFFMTIIINGFFNIYFAYQFTKNFNFLD